MYTRPSLDSDNRLTDILRREEDRFWDEYADRAFSSLVAQRRHIEAILKRQKELEEQRDSPNLREHVPRMEK